MNEWHLRVYHPTNNKRISNALRARLLDQSGYKCQVKVCGSGKRLEVHHIIPRDLLPIEEWGRGAEDETNLIVLCLKCHDEIEEAGLRTEAQIKAYIPDYIAKGKSHVSATARRTVPNSEQYPAESIPWQTWVYGGARNPRK